MPSAAAISGSLCVRLASSRDRRRIHQLRHEVYAAELGQHACNAEAELHDPLDRFNEYLVVAQGEELCGFLSITPPGQAQYSLDKYLPREQWPFPIDDGLYELRLLTVLKSRRAGPYAALLMHAAQRYLDMWGATRVMAIGRCEVLHLYEKIGMQRMGHTFQSGAVAYELMAAVLRDIEPDTARFEPLLRRWQPRVQWELACPFLPSHESGGNKTISGTNACYHGGEFFKGIGTSFHSLIRRHDVINADVLDAWFPPAPAVMRELSDHLDWLLRTSPPTQCEGLIAEIAKARGVPAACIVPGAGSSDLIFRAMTRWLKPGARVLLLDPTYGEYRHVFRHVVPCHVDSLDLTAEDGFAIDVNRFAWSLRQNYDLVVLVNPNNPTGTHLPRRELEPILKGSSPQTRIWIDEAYVDYLGTEESLERFAAGSDNVAVCKSMSKAYALSGVRVGYLCGPQELMNDLRSITPPWAVSLPAQVAGVWALRDFGYYAQRFAETRILRNELAAQLVALGLTVWPGSANFLLCGLPTSISSVEMLLARCREQNLYLRDVASMTSRTDALAGLFRVAVKDAETNRRMIEIMRGALADTRVRVTCHA